MLSVVYNKKPLCNRHIYFILPIMTNIMHNKLQQLLLEMQLIEVFFSFKILDLFYAFLLFCLLLHTPYYQGLEKGNILNVQHMIIVLQYHHA